INPICRDRLRNSASSAFSSEPVDHVGGLNGNRTHATTTKKPEFRPGKGHRHSTVDGEKVPRCGKYPVLGVCASISSILRFEKEAAERLDGVQRVPSGFVQVNSDRVTPQPELLPGLRHRRIGVDGIRPPYASSANCSEVVPLGLGLYRKLAWVTD